MNELIATTVGVVFALGIYVIARWLDYRKGVKYSQRRERRKPADSRWTPVNPPQRRNIDKDTP